MSLAILSMLGVQAMAAGRPETTCGDLKTVYKEGACCGAPATALPVQVVPDPTTRMTGTNPCAGKKSLTTALDNTECFHEGVRQAIEQSGADVTEGFQGNINTTVDPINVPYYKTALCPVNVHWHLGAEHRSEGQYDEAGKSPAKAGTPASTNPNANRRLADGEIRYGYACHHYDA